MTNKARLISLLGFKPSNDDALEGALIDAGLTGADVYVSGNSDSIKRAFIQVARLLITTADTTPSDIGMGIRYDRDALLKLIAQYEKDLGIIVDEKPTITNKSYVW
jgi:hypothetical protein